MSEAHETSHTTNIILITALKNEFQLFLIEYRESYKGFFFQFIIVVYFLVLYFIKLLGDGGGLIACFTKHVSCPVHVQSHSESCI